MYEARVKWLEGDKEDIFLIRTWSVPSAQGNIFTLITTNGEYFNINITKTKWIHIKEIRNE